MNINIELFDKEPIENLITCLNFKLDKVVYLGYCDVMTQEAIETTRKSLKRLCGDIEAEFIEVSRKELNKVVEALDRVVRKEIAEGNKCFFDLTGGEDLVLVAMGILSIKHDCPMHRFDVTTGALRMMNRFEMPGIEVLLEKKEVTLTLDDLIKLQGGVIVYDDKAEYLKHLEEEEFFKDVKALWSIGVKSNKKWNGFTGVLKECNKYIDEALGVGIPENKLKSIANNARGIDSYGEFFDYMEELKHMGIIRDFFTERGLVHFTYKNKSMKEIVTDAGKVLELVTYYERKRTGKYSDCRTSVKIDWDGVVKGDKSDVRNEIDVVVLEGYVPTFISCKNGNVDQMPLYELDTVAERFGGKYVKKEIYLGEEMQITHLNRAKELNIATVIPGEDALSD